MTPFERLSAMHQARARGLALRYPVSTDYVAALLLEFPPEKVVEILDHFASMGAYPAPALVIETFKHGLGKW